MKKTIILSLVTFTVKILSAQSSVVVTAEAFKSNPKQYVGKIVTIQNVKLISNRPPSSTMGGNNMPLGKLLNLNTPSGTVAPGSPAPNGLPSRGSSSNIIGDAFCNDIPNFSLSKWSLGPNNEICVQVGNVVKPQLDQLQVGEVVKSITFRCNENVYNATKIEK